MSSQGIPHPARALLHALPVAGAAHGHAQGQHASQPHAGASAGAGHFGGAVFQHVPSHLWRRPPPRSAGRTANRSAAQGLQRDGDESSSASSESSSPKRSDRVIAVLEQGFSQDRQDEKDQSDDSDRGDREPDERWTQARFRALPGRAARPTAVRAGPAPIAVRGGGGTDPSEALARQALAAIGRLGVAVRPARVRAAWLQQVRALLEAGAAALPRRHGVAGIRHLLIEAARTTPHEPAARQAARDLLCLLPLVLLNLERPRTVPQVRLAATKLGVMARLP